MWEIVFLPEASKDISELDNSVRLQVNKGILKVSQNPLSKSEGGYGEPLGNLSCTNLSGLYKIKFKKIGIRVVYGLIRIDKIMRIIIVSARSNNYCYDEADKRKQKHKL